jgi:chorismate mutase / prephenate dehydratase
MPDQTQTVSPEPAAPADTLPAAPPPDLAALRAEIDGIDDALHDLLMRRAGISAGMAASRVKGTASTFRPAREANILRRLLGRHAGPLPRAVVVQVWRDIIASSLAQQGAFSMVVQGGAESTAARMARGHFGLLTPLKLHPTPSRVLAAVAAGEASVAILPAPEEGEAPETAWWMQMEAPRLQVVAALPFLADRAEPQAFAVAAMPPEPSGRDRTLLRLEPAPEHSRARIVAAFAAAGLPARWLLRHDLPAPAALAEVEGFLLPDDARLAALPFPRTQILGAYAEPVTEDPAP